MTGERIFILFDGGEPVQKLTDDLALWGMCFRPMQGASLCSLESMGASASDAYIMVQIQTAALLADIGRLRCDYPACGIVIYQSGQTLVPEQRCLLLLAGADVCFDESANRMEMLASVQALRRRGIALAMSLLPQREGTEDKSGSVIFSSLPSGRHTWQLAQNGWHLISPNRVSISLTTGEREVIEILFELRPRPVSRQDLMSRLGKPIAPGSRPVDVVVGRLKKKIAQYGEVSPVRTIRGVGYAFIS